MNEDYVIDRSGPHLGILCRSDVPDSIAIDFETEVAAEGLDLLIERRPAQQIYAGIEWLMPTAIIAYVAKSYFDGFLKEMGKEHYLALKAALKSLAERLSKVKFTRIGTAGKISEASQYSPVFSILFDRHPDGNFKFLIPENLEPEEFDRAMAALFDFMEAYLASDLGDRKSQESIQARLAAAKPYGSTILLAYNPSTQEIEAIDPLASVAAKP